MRRSFWQLLALLPLLLAVLSASAEELRVGGTGSSQPIIQLLFDEFRKQAPEVALRQLSPPIGSGGALKALAAGRIDLGVIGRPLNPESRQASASIFSLPTRLSSSPRATGNRRMALPSNS
jgi:ABC-type phosphate transport system, periplasmic component